MYGNTLNLCIRYFARIKKKLQKVPSTASTYVLKNAKNRKINFYTKRSGRSYVNSIGKVNTKNQLSSGIGGQHAIVAAAAASSATVVVLPVEFANNEIPDTNPCTY